ncbi:MAG: hypothetical protein QXE52_03995, partial [Candidatus Caldarchaeum sp.]
LNDDLIEISLRAAKAVGGEFVSVDIFETVDGSYLVNEVNGVPEFKGLMRATSTDIPEKVMTYLFKSSRR